MNREIKTEVKTYEIQMSCQQCDGTMFSTGMVFSTYPAWYEHKCNKCEYKESFKESYPKIIYEK